MTIGDSIGSQPSIAIPDCLPLTPDETTRAAGRTLAQVLWDDLDFEREFRLIPRDVYRTIPAAGSLVDLPFGRWREIGADGVVTLHRRGPRKRPVRGDRPPVLGPYRRVGVRRHLPQLPPQPPPHRAPARGRDTPAPARPRGAWPARGSRSSRTATAESVFGLVENRPGEGNLHRRLRRREPAAGHGVPHPQHEPGVVARRPVHRVHVVAHRVPRRRGLVPVRGPDGEAGRRRRPAAELPARVLAGRPACRLQLEPRQQQRHLRRQRRRHRCPAAHEPPRHRHEPHVVAQQPADRVHVRSHRRAADLRGRRRRHRPAAADLRELLRPADVVAAAVQRDRLLVADQLGGTRHQGAGSGHERGPSTDVRARLERESELRPQRPATSRSCRRATRRSRSTRLAGTAGGCAG